MDEISRELPPDTTGDEAAHVRPASPREARTGGRHGDAGEPSGKGPTEWVAHERSTIAGDLVVKASWPAEPVMTEGPGDGAPAEQQSAGEQPAGEQLAEPVGEQPAEELAEQPAELPEGAEEVVDAQAALAAVADEASALQIEEEYEGGEEDGLPAVPELTDAAEVAKLVFVLMLSSREGLSLLRLAQTCNTTQKLVEEALVLLQAQLQSLGLPVELTRTQDTVKWLSSPSTFVHLQRLRGVKKLEKLSPAALETLAVVAYRQPVMRGEIEAIRGVKAGPMLRTLLQHKLVKVTGRADVPGRPLQYGTTPLFLERFGIASLQELPSVKEWKNLG